MRKILMLVVMVVMAVVAMAQTPNKISYQAVIRDGQNRLVTSSPVTVQVQIGTYSETFNVTTNANGLVSLQIPTDPANQAAFDGINWASTNTITTTVTVGSEPAMTNTVPVTAVPYALYANNVNPSVIDTLVSEHELQVILNDYYTKIGVDTLLDKKLDKTALDTLVTDNELKAAIDTLVTENELKAAIDTLVTDNELKAAIDTLVTDRELAAAIDTLVTERELADTLDYYYTKIGVDTLLAAKADTSDIGKGKYTLLHPVTGEVIIDGEISVNYDDSTSIRLPGNPLTLKFQRNGEEFVAYNAFGHNDETVINNAGTPSDPTDDYVVIDLKDTITTQAIVKYILAARADSHVNDIDSISRAFRAKDDVRNAIYDTIKAIAMRHERDAMDIALYYFKHFDGDDVRYILDHVDSADIANFINNVNTLTPADANKIMGALAASVNAAQVGQLVKALSDRISAAQAREFINAVIGNIDASQVDVLIDTLNDAANADANSAAGRLKARIDAHINALIEARIQQYI